MKSITSFSELASEITPRLRYGAVPPRVVTPIPTAARPADPDYPFSLVTSAINLLQDQGFKPSLTNHAMNAFFHYVANRRGQVACYDDLYKTKDNGVFNIVSPVGINNRYDPENHFVVQVDISKYGLLQSLKYIPLTDFLALTKTKTVEEIFAARPRTPLLAARTQTPSHG